MKQKIVASLFALLFAIPFGGIGLGAAYLMAAMIYDGVRARDWVLVKAEVTGPASYRYTIGGQTYEGARLGTLRIGGSSDVDDFDERVAGMLAEGREQKKPITVFVNPDAPSEAMVDREIRWALLLFLTPFAAAFGGIGLGALWLVRRLYTDETHPKNAAKAKARAKAQAAMMSNASSGAGGLWFFAIVWNAISFPVAFFAIPQGMAEGEWGVLFVLLFPLVGIGVLWAAISATFERLRGGGAPASAQLNKQRRST